MKKGKKKKSLETCSLELLQFAGRLENYATDLLVLI